MIRDRLSAYAAVQSIAEIFIGSAVHGLRIPLGGHFLSLNQALILVFATRGEPKRRESISLACGIANVAALLKSLSMAGGKLSPMVAIGMQGWLFALGLGILGANLLGAVLGAVLLALWAFLHPLLGAYFLFGARFFEALTKLWTDLAQTLGIAPELGLWILMGAVALKIALAVGIAVSAWFASPQAEARYFQFIERQRERWVGRQPAKQAHESVAPLRGAATDLLRPLFLLSFALSLALFFVGRDPSLSQVLLYGVRVLAVAILLFWSLRALPLQWKQRLMGRYPQIETAANQIFRSREPARDHPRC